MIIWPHQETAETILEDMRSSMIFRQVRRQRLDPSIIEAETSQIPSDEPYSYEECDALNYDEVKTHNRFVSRLECLTCGEYEPENEIVLCELTMVRKCESACHLKCFEPAWEKIPDEQWICDKCTSVVGCTVCGKNTDEKLVACDCCHKVMHRGCTGEETMKPITSEWQCSSCACAVCGKQELSKIECQRCSRKFHPECVSDFNYEDETCDRCVFDESAEDIAALETKMTSLESSGNAENAEQEELSLDQFIQHCMELLGTETDNIQRCLAEKQIRNLKCLETNPSTAMNFVALQLYADGVKLAPKHWEVLARGIATRLKLDHLDRI
jgi:hypothetical protein